MLWLTKLLKGFGLLEYLIIFSPIADVLVGIGKHNSIPLVALAGPLSKAALVIYILLKVFTSKRVSGWQGAILISALLVCLLHVAYIFLAYGTTGIIDNLNTTIRFWFFILCGIGIFCVYKGTDASEKIHRMLVIVTLLYSALLIVPTLMGINNAAYSDWLNKVGSAGLFYEANEIGIICGALGSYMMMYYFQRRTSLFYLVVASVAMCAGLMTGTKAPLFYLAVALVYVIISSLTNIRRAVLSTISLILIIPLVIVASQGVLSNIASSYERQVEDGAGNVSDLIYNGRDKLLVDSINVFQREYTLYDKIFGDSSVDRDGVEKKDTEMDFADILFHFGIAGFIVYMSSIIVITARIVFYRPRSKRTIEKLCFLTGILAAALMGHTLSSPSVGLILILFAAIVFSEQVRRRNRNIYG